MISIASWLWLRRESRISRVTADEYEIEERESHRGILPADAAELKALVAGADGLVGTDTLRHVRTRSLPTGGDE